MYSANKLKNHVQTKKRTLRSCRQQFPRSSHVLFGYLFFYIWFKNVWIWIKKKDLLISCACMTSKCFIVKRLFLKCFLGCSKYFSDFLFTIRKFCELIKWFVCIFHITKLNSESVILLKWSLKYVIFWILRLKLRARRESWNLYRNQEFCRIKKRVQHLSQIHPTTWGEK